MHSIIDQIKQAGVVGAGGAGFPAHVKYGSKSEILLANGAECEPLIHKDKELMRLFPNEIKKGIEVAKEASSANRVILGIKAKHEEIIRRFEGLFGGTDIEIHQMGDYYPAGDEYVLVYGATGRLIPYGGYPVDIGCVVNNVETLLNIGLATSNLNVTEKFITISGAVKHPMTLRVPIGTLLSDIIELAGGTTIEETAALDGGAMMGQLLADYNSPVTKTTGGYIILPKEHMLIRRRNQTIPEIKRIGQSACDQCTYCTEFCPRYLLGYEIEPHKVMRSLGFAGEKDDAWGKFALNCCECNLCTLYACPEDLDPKQACVRSKRNVLLKKLTYQPPARELKAHPMQSHRNVSINKLTRRLGLMPYDRPAPYTDPDFNPNQVLIPLKQHVGVPAHPVISVGDSVHVGQLIGKIEEGKLGANVHASINGRVTSVNDMIRIEAN